METSRILINAEHQNRRKSLESVIDFLSSQKIDSERHYFRFDIDPSLHPITAEAIRALLALPYEIALTESKENIIVLETGFAIHTGGGPDFVKRRDHSKLSMHTHRIPHIGHTATNTPSFTDAYMTTFTSKQTSLILAMPSGLLRYGKPIYDPINRQAWTGDPRALVVNYAKYYGIALLPSRATSHLRPYSDLPEADKVVLQRQYADDTGMIIAEASWDDMEGLKPLLAIINLQT